MSILPVTTWKTNGHHKAVKEFVFYSKFKIATLEDFRNIQSVKEAHERHEYEPQTIDFEYESAPEIYKRAQRVMSLANSQFGFHLDRWQQPLRFNHYTENKEFKWHTDYTQKDNSKLAFIHMVKPAGKGGETQLVVATVPTKINLRAGETLIFPAYIMHSVSKIEAGERIALVGWATGNRFM